VCPRSIKKTKRTIMTKRDKLYVPGCLAKEQVLEWGTLIHVSFHVPRLLSFVQTHQTDRGYITLDVVPRRELGKYGETHSVSLNTWSPTERAKVKQPQQDLPVQQPKEIYEDDVPF